MRSITAPGALNALILELRHYRCNIIAVQETKWSGQHSFKCNSYMVLLSGGKNRTFGTGFLVDKKWTEHIIDWRPVNDRICILRIKGRFFNYSIINVHAPHLERPQEEKDAFYTSLDDLYKSCPQHDIKIVIGDLNAQIGREDIYKPHIGKFSLHRETNENGLRLINFAATNNMVISSTCFRHKNIHKATWKPPGDRRRNQIDHMVIDRRHASEVLDVRSYRLLGADLDHHDSDHFMIGAKLRARISNINRFKGQNIRRIDVTKLRQEDTKQRFNEQLDHKLESLGEESSWPQYQEVIHRTAEEILGYQQKVKNEWFDEECQLAVQKVIDARKGRITRQKREEIRVMQREKKKVLRKKKREFDNAKLQVIENMHSQNEARKFYKAVNEAKNGFQPRIEMCRRKNGDIVADKQGVLDRWREHFETLLNSSSESNDTASLRPKYQQDDGINIEAPSLAEVKDAITRLKNNKAPGEDGLPAELFKSGCQGIVTALHKLIAKIWSEEKLPEKWMISVICPLHKKGCKTDCGNFRGISLLPTAYKVLSIILSDRLVPLMEDFLHPYQTGFRRGMSTSDQLFCIRQILQKSYERNTETNHLFIDFKSAYDTINREALWDIMAEFRFPHKLIRLLKATMEAVICCVKVQGALSATFESKIGLRQGDGLSTQLFNIALEGVIRRAKVEVLGSIFTKSVQLLGFADDVDIVGRNVRAVKDTYSRLEKEANKIGLRVNEDKTKFLMVSPSPRTKAIVGNHLQIGDKKFEVVEEFRYLGAIVNNKGNNSQEISSRIMAGQRAFYGLKRVLTSKNISRNAKVRMYKTLIRPVVLYGCESWATTKNDEETLGVFERKILRSILGFVEENGIRRRRYNHELYQLYQEPDIVRILRHRRLSWAGHVIRRPDENPISRAYKGEFSDGTRNRGRPKNSWLSAVDEDARSLGLSSWQSEAKDRDSYAFLLNNAVKVPRGLWSH